MDESVTFIGTFRIPAPQAWLSAIAAMSAFVEANVPRMRSFHAYANDDTTEGIVVYVHPDAASLDQHLEAAATLIAAGTAMVEVIRIELLGLPNQETVERLRSGGPRVSVKQHVAGFTR
jgi:hypothetical protein